MSQRDSSDAGTPADSDAFKLFTEIDMIAHLSATLFQRALPAGTTIAQFGVLNRLARLNTHETISELAKAFLVSQPTMTSTVKKLLAKQYVALQPSKTDKRQRLVSITALGSGHRDTITASLGPLYPDIESTIPPGELARTLATLFRLRQTIEDRVHSKG